MLLPLHRVSLAAALLATASTARAETAPRDPAKICAEVCSTCHGANLTGNAGPNLLDANWNHGGDDASVLRSIRRGYPESNMPSFEGVFSEAELHGLVAYLRQQGAEFA